MNPDGEGIIVAGAMLGQGEGGTPIYFRTTDGGVHWQPMPYPAGVRAWGSAYFKDAREGWVAAYPGETYHTTDGAQTWSRSKTFDVQQAFGRSGGLQGQIAFRNADDGVFVPYGMVSGTGIPITPPHLWATRDGGATWMQVDLAVPAGEKLDSSNTGLAATMLPDGTCIVLAQGRSMPRAPGSPTPPNAVPQSPTPVYAYRSTDGGLTFGPLSALPITRSEGPTISWMPNTGGWEMADRAWR